ncbi:MAG TPA: citrate synthase [Kofleriaceae bacterium]|nr:citrate synthase [Kofleriaceae bacterium]
MTKVDQRRFDNQRPDRADYVTARQAAEILELKLPSLYAYVSRGLLRSVAGPSGRPRRYLRADLDRLLARRDARRGHGPVAAGALRWGEPVLDSAITEITAEGPRYRGRLATELMSGHTFEAVAELLIGGALPAADAWWPAPLPDPPALPRGVTPIEALSIAVPMLAARDRARFDRAPAVELRRARELLGILARCAGPRRARAARARGSIAAITACSFGVRATPATAELLDRALIAIADHELNVSTFAARVAASAGADLYASTSAALAALSGPLHGGACDRIEAVIEACGSSRGARALVTQRARRGEGVPGFGHRLYPDGDPRARPVLELAYRIGEKVPAVRTARALARAMTRAGHEPPTIDYALVVTANALGMPAGAATALFAIGRTAGWIAHAFEQRDAGFMLRPRARFVGVA